MGGWLVKSSKVELETNMPHFNSGLKNVSTSPRITWSPEQLERDERGKRKNTFMKCLGKIMIEIM